MQKELKKILLDEIKSKQQIKSLDDDFILEKLEKYFLTNGDKRKKLEKEFDIKQEKIIKNKLFKEIIKIIRSEIGIVYGSYLTSDFTKKEKILESINTIEELDELFYLHKSTRERINYFSYIYQKIFDWYKEGTSNSKGPKIILDIACGFNPISIGIIKEELDYCPVIYGSDLNPNDMRFLNNVYNKLNLKGKFKSYDITKLEILENEEFQKADLVFLFKAIDSFEQVKKNISKKIIEGLNAKKIVVSFPTKSLVSKKRFKIEKRNWFFKFLNGMKYTYEKFEVEGEIFILINK